MTGVVHTRHLFSQSLVIVSEFGVGCLARCLWRTVMWRRPVTFLECAVKMR
jgi:hypothetical protein